MREQLRAVSEPPSRQVRELFDHWREATSHERAKLTSDRASKIRARLRDGYSPADLLRAIDGAAAKPEVVNGRTYDDLTSIFKGGATVEKYMGRAPQSRRRDWLLWCETNVPELPSMLASVVAERIVMANRTPTPMLVREQYGLSHYGN